MRPRVLAQEDLVPVAPAFADALETIRGQIKNAAADWIDRVTQLSRFELMTELAPQLPLTIVRS